MTITSNHIAEFLALATSVIFWNSVKKGKLRWLPYFLLFILLVELTGSYLKRTPYANIILYNITIPIEYLFYIFIHWLHGKKQLKPVSLVSAAVLILTALFFFIADPIKEFHSYVVVIADACVIACCCTYLYEQFQNSEEESLLKNYFFWITSGLLLFNLGDMCYFLMYRVIHFKNWDQYDDLFKSINGKLLLLLYLSYIIAIIVHKKYVRVHARFS